MRRGQRFTSCPQMKRLIAAAEQQGWTVSLTNGGHIKFTAADGTPVFAPSSPSDHRSWKNARSLLRRHGLMV